MITELELAAIINGSLCDICPYMRSLCDKDYELCVIEYLNSKEVVKANYQKNSKRRLPNVERG